MRGGKRYGAAVLPVPKETEEQKILYKWASLQACKYPELRLLYHIPNEGKRSPITGARLKEEGLRTGFPDNCLPVPRGIYGAFYFEMKRRKGNKPSEAQEEWLKALRAAGNKAEVFRSWEDAAKALLEYLNSEGKRW